MLKKDLCVRILCSAERIKADMKKSGPSCSRFCLLIFFFEALNFSFTTISACMKDDAARRDLGKTVRRQ